MISMQKRGDRKLQKYAPLDYPEHSFKLRACTCPYTTNYTQIGWIIQSTHAHRPAYLPPTSSCNPPRCRMYYCIVYIRYRQQHDCDSITGAVVAHRPNVAFSHTLYVLANLLLGEHERILSIRVGGGTEIHGRR